VRQMVAESLEDRQLMAAEVFTDKLDYAPNTTAIITTGTDGGFTNNFFVGETIEFQVVRTDGIDSYGPSSEPWQVTDGVGGFEPYQSETGTWVYPDLDGQADGLVATTWFVDVQYANAALEVTATGLNSGESASRAFTDAAIVISANTNWSAITTGSGVGGQPTSADTIVVNPGATLTIDVNNAVVGGVTLGNNTAGTATIAFSGTNRVATFASLTNTATGTAQLNISSTNELRVGDSTNFTYSGSIGPSTGAGALVKIGTGIMTLTSNVSFAGTVGVGQGTLRLSGSGALPSAVVTVNHNGILDLNNAAGTATGRLGTTNAITMSGGELVLTASATAVAESAGQLVITDSDSIVTVVAGAGGAILNFASISRTAGGTVLFRGTNLGQSTVTNTSTPAANTANIFFGTAPTLNGGTKISETPILSYAIASGSATTTGTALATYNYAIPAAGSNANLALVTAVNGMRPITTAEYSLAAFSGSSANDNSLNQASVTASQNRTFNSLSISPNTNATPTLTLAAQSGPNLNQYTININTQLVSAPGSNSANTNNIVSGVLGFGATQGIINVAGGNTLNIGGTGTAATGITGSAGLIVTGTGTVNLLNPITLTSGTNGIRINRGTLRTAAANVLNGASNAVSIQPAGTLNLNGNSDSVASLTLEGSITSASTVATGTGTLTLNGDVTSNIDSIGSQATTISGNLALGAATRTFTVADGVSNVDMTVSAVVSGTSGLTKAGPGTLQLTATNTYTGATTVSAGTLLVDGATNASSAVTVSAGGTIGGGSGATFGTIGGTLTVNGDVSPGQSYGTNGTGILKAGATTFNSGSRFRVDLNGTASGSFDQLDLDTANLTLTGATVPVLNVSLASGYTPAIGNSFRIIKTTGTVTGTFSGLANNATFVSGTTTFQVNYASGTGVTLTVVGATATVAVTSSSATTTYGDRVTFTATVTTSGIQATGTLTFKDGANVIASNVAFTSQSSTVSTGTFEIFTLTAGSHAISVDFVGTGSFGTSSSTSITQTVNQKALTAVGTLVFAGSKTYDGTTAATPTSGAPALQSAITAGTSVSSDGKPISGDTVTLSGAAAYAYNSKDVASATTIATTGLSLTGASASNYTLTQPSFSATITAKGLTVTGVTASNKVYNANTTATLVTGSAALSGVVAGDTSLVTLSTASAAGAFADKNVGNGKTVTASGFSISGTASGNYSLAQPTGLTADITAAALTVSNVSANNKVYDATTAATLVTTTAALSGVISGDTVTLTKGTSGTFADKNVGTSKTVTTTGFAIGGTDAGNYTLTQPTTTANITAAALTVSNVSANNKVYDATTAATLVTTTAALSGVISGDTVTLTKGTSGTFADKNV
ncbi:MAG: beta strand repeat-containing protein, partial [Planctomycetota bacterium]